MQEGGKIAVAVSVTFMSGVVVGWLLNTYTRKVWGLEHVMSCRNLHLAALVGSSSITLLHTQALPPPFSQHLHRCVCLCLAGPGEVFVKHADKGQEHLSHASSTIHWLGQLLRADQLAKHQIVIAAAEIADIQRSTAVKMKT